VSRLRLKCGLAAISRRNIPRTTKSVPGLSDRIGWLSFQIVLADPQYLVSYLSLDGG
jgi:hypothetical protein